MEGGENPDNQQTPNINTGNNVEQNQTKQSIDGTSVETVNTQSITSNQAVAPEAIEQTVNQLAENAVNTDQTAEPALPHEKMIEELEKETPVEQPNQPAPQVIKKERKLIKLFRIVVWLLVAVALPVGVSLRARSESIESFADGTSSLKLSVGNTIFYIALVVGGLNLIWGIVRWVLRIKRKHCTVGRVIGKLIGGGIWRTAVFTPIVILSLFIFSGMIETRIELEYQEIQEKNTPSVSRIQSDYDDGQINADEYVTFILDASFSPGSLPEQYQSNLTQENLPEILDFVEAHINELSEKTLVRINQDILAGGVKFGLDASSNKQQTSAKGGLFANNAYAYDATSFSVLNKAELSKNEHFIIFYTDTGIDMISDDDAERIGDMLEEKISRYEEQFGLEFAIHSEKNLSGSKSEQMMEVLEDSGIGLEHLDTAIPVYVIDPESEDSGTLAYYVGTSANNIGYQILNKLAPLFDAENIIYTSPVFPLIVFRPSTIVDDSSDEVITHELGHHYQAEYCFEKTGDHKCKTGLFSSEGMAQLFALNITDKHSQDSFLNDHHNLYIKSGACNQIDYSVSGKHDRDYCGYINEKVEQFGYSTTAFWENYLETVTDSRNKILNSLLAKDGLSYVYEQAGEAEFLETMELLSQRNILNNYKEQKKNNALYSATVPSGETILCNSVCENKYSISGASIRYFYLDSSNISNSNITISAPDNLAVTIFENSDGKTKILTNGHGSIGESFAENYDKKVIIAVANGKLEIADFVISIKHKNLEEMLLEADFKDPFVGLDDGCYEIDINEMLLLPGKIARIINQIDENGDLSNFANEIQRITDESEDARNEVKKYRVVVCMNTVSKNKTFEEEKTIMRNVFSNSMGVFDYSDDEYMVSVLASINPFSKTGNVYSLINIDDERLLFTINISMI